MNLNGSEYRLISHLYGVSGALQSRCSIESGAGVNPEQSIIHACHTFFFVRPLNGIFISRLLTDSQRHYTFRTFRYYHKQWSLVVWPSQPNTVMMFLTVTTLQEYLMLSITTIQEYHRYLSRSTQGAFDTSILILFYLLFIVICSFNNMNQYSYCTYCLIIYIYCHFSYHQAVISVV